MPEPVGASKDVALTDMRERWDRAQNEWRDIRDEGKSDMRAVSGDPWPEKDRQKRLDSGRPVLSLDELSQYVNQLINEVRQYKRAVRVAPVGYGANDKLAEFRQNLIRQIEYRSNAQVAYTTMFENTVQRSYGYLRITSRYLTEQPDPENPSAMFDQELRIVPIVNPDLVTIDPDILEPDGSDMRYAWVAEQWTLKDYKKAFPKAEVRDFDPELAKDAPTWLTDDTIRVAEYWSIDPKERTFELRQGPSGQRMGLFTDQLRDLPELKEWSVLQSRTVEGGQVTKRLTNGFEWLEKPTDWPGKHIPLVFCPGKVLFVDEGSGSKRKILSLIRLARDPFMLYNYYRTTEAELVGMTPKFPYFWYEGSLSPEAQEDLAKSLHEPVAGIKVKARIEGLPPGTPPPFPQRQPYDPPIQAMEVGAESARRAIQAAIGTTPLPTDAQRLNQKSGKALQRIEASSQRGSFHFLDHYDSAISRVGVILDDLIPHFYDTARDVTVRTPTDTVQTVRINDETADEPIQTKAGVYDITISTGPAEDSEREAASDFADALLDTPFGPLVADLAVKLKNVGPIGDEIAERLFTQLPPVIQAMEAQQGDPKALLFQMHQQLQQAKEQIQLLSQELQQRTQQIETDAVKAERDVALKSAEWNAKAAIEVAKIDSSIQQKFQELEVKLEIELGKLGSAIAMKRGELEMQQLHQHDSTTLEREKLGAQQAQADLDRQAARDAQQNPPRE